MDAALVISNYEKLMKMVALAEVPYERVVGVLKLTKSGCSYTGCADVSMDLVDLDYASPLNKFFYPDPTAMASLRAVDSVAKLRLDRTTEVLDMAGRAQEPHVWMVTTALRVAFVLSHLQKFDGTLAVILNLTAHLTLSWHLSIGGY